MFSLSLNILYTHAVRTIHKAIPCWAGNMSPQIKCRLSDDIFCWKTLWWVKEGKKGERGMILNQESEKEPDLEQVRRKYDIWSSILSNQMYIITPNRYHLHLYIPNCYQMIVISEKKHGRDNQIKKGTSEQAREKKILSNFIGFATQSNQNRTEEKTRLSRFNDNKKQQPSSMVQKNSDGIWHFVAVNEMGNVSVWYDWDCACTRVPFHSQRKKNQWLANGWRSFVYQLIL